MRAETLGGPYAALPASPSGRCCPTSPTATPSCAGTPPGPPPSAPGETLAGIIPADSPAMITFAAIARSGDVLAEAAR